MSKGATRRTLSSVPDLTTSAGLAILGALLGWQLGAAAVGLSVIAVVLVVPHVRRPHAAGIGSDRELNAHLARARRREDLIDLVVVRMRDGEEAAAHRLGCCLRVTDSAQVSLDGSGVELCAIVDRERLDRDALERRLRELAPGSPQIGWAQFPEDGLTLPALIGAARHASLPQAEPGPVSRPLPVTQSFVQEVAGG
jgi:hypothetical protein